MSSRTSNGYFRFENGTAGYYLFGGTPTVVDPRLSKHHETALTNVHEQSHRDLINNTIYGYVLRRLRELQELGVQAIAALAVDDLLGKLSEGTFQCAEGAATAMEILSMENRPEADRRALLEAMPADYQAALSIYLPIIQAELPFAVPIDFLIRAALAQAVQEVAADWSLLTATQTSEPDFCVYALLVASAAAPDQNLPVVMALADNLTLETFAELLDQSKHLAGDFARLARALVLGLKVALLRQGLGASRDLPSWVLDDGRLELFGTLDATLAMEHAGIRPIVWQSGKVFGAAVEVETKEPDFLLEEENVAPSDLLVRMGAIAKGAGFSGFVAQYFCDQRKPAYSLIANPVIVNQNTMDMGQPYLIAENVPREVLDEIDRSGIPLAWLTWGLAVLKDGGFYDWELAASMRSPVFVRMNEFSWERADLASQRFAGARQIVMYDIPGLQGICAGAIRRQGKTVFNVLPARFMPEFDLGQDATHGDLSEDATFSAVVMVALRTSKEQTV